MPVVLSYWLPKISFEGEAEGVGDQTGLDSAQE